MSNESNHAVEIADLKARLAEKLRVNPALEGTAQIDKLRESIAALEAQDKFHAETMQRGASESAVHVTCRDEALERNAQEAQAAVDNRAGLGGWSWASSGPKSWRNADEARWQEDKGAA